MSDVETPVSILNNCLLYGDFNGNKFFYVTSDLDQNCYISYYTAADNEHEIIIAIIEQHVVTVLDGLFVDLFKKFAKKHKKTLVVTKAPMFLPEAHNRKIWSTPNWEVLPNPRFEERTIYQFTPTNIDVAESISVDPVDIIF